MGTVLKYFVVPFLIVWGVGALTYLMGYLTGNVGIGIIITLLFVIYVRLLFWILR